MNQTIVESTSTQVSLLATPFPLNQLQPVQIQIDSDTDIESLVEENNVTEASLVRKSRRSTEIWSLFTKKEENVYSCKECNQVNVLIESQPLFKIITY